MKEFMRDLMIVLALTIFVVGIILMLASLVGAAEPAFERIVVHHTVTDWDMSKAECDKLHQVKGWESCGYNYLVHLDGRIEVARGLEQIGAHVKGHNSTSIGIAFVMDGRVQLLTNEAVNGFRKLVRLIRSKYGWLPVVGHNDLAATECPSSHVYGTVVTPARGRDMLIEALSEK